MSGIDELNDLFDDALVPGWSYRKQLRVEGMFRRFIGQAGSTETAYTDDFEPRLLGEDDRGYLIAPMDPAGSRWELVSAWSWRHWVAAFRTRKVGKLNMLELE